MIQNALNKYTDVSLGVGLPVGDFTNYKDKTMQYYVDNLGKAPVEFVYCGFNFKFSLNKVLCFPQDLLPVAANPHCNIAKKYHKKYLIIGIGGMTVDVIPVINGLPVADSCVSLRMGVRRMFSDIISRVESNFGMSIGEDTVEEVLAGEETILPSEVEILIRSSAKDHANSLINGCIQRGFNFSEYPVVFFGGGGLLLQPYLKNNQYLQVSEFLPDVNGNARYYAARIPD